MLTGLPMNLFPFDFRDCYVAHVFAQRSFKIALALFASMGLTHVAMASPTEGYPPPGGVTYSHGTYSNLNPTAYSDIYWGLADTTALSAGAGLNGSLNTLAFSGVSGSTEYFTGTTAYTDAYGAYSGDNISVPIELAITLNSGGTWVSASSLGLSSGLGDLVDISGTSFSVSEKFYANFSDIPGSGLSGYQAINNVEQLGGGLTQTSFTGGFYTDPPAASGVPDTAGTFALMGFSLIGLLGLRRRFSIA